MSSTPTSDASTKVGSDVADGFELDPDHAPAHHVKSLRNAHSNATRPAVVRDVLLFLVAFRLLNALSIRTFFQPDEYFQSLEPAWSIAFGEDSGAWITWEWKYQLRSSFHPYLFAAAYWLLAHISSVLSLAPSYRAELLIAGPKILQACLAAAGDYYTWKLGEGVYGRDSAEAWFSLALTVLSPWQWFCSTRTLSNCLETTLTVLALNHWPWNPSAVAMRTSANAHSTKICLTAAAIASILRPTNLIIWFCLLCYSFFQRTARHQLQFPVWARTPVWVSFSFPALSRSGADLTKFLHDAVLCGTLVLMVSTIFDRLFYQLWTFPPFHFLYFNIAQSLAVFYGRNDWHYYLSQGFPLLLTTFLPFALTGLYDAFKLNPATSRYKLGVVTLVMPLVLSLISHKEVRFIYPLLPILHVLASSPATRYLKPALSTSLFSETSPRTTSRYVVVGLMLAANVSIAIFSTQMHQRGPLDVMSFLRRQHEQYYLTQPPAVTHLALADTTMTVGFLMPCHSTPWRSHLIHPGIKAWALGCEPPVHLSATERTTYLDEADQFYEHPREFLDRTLGPLRKDSVLGGKLPRQGLGLDGHTASDYAWNGKTGKKAWPDYLVFFQQLEPTMQEVARGSNYTQCWRGWSSFFHDDWRRQGDIIVWCQSSMRLPN